MLTVKLGKRNGNTTIYEATRVRVFNSGPATGTAPDPKDRTPDVMEVEISKPCGNTEAFYVANPDKPRPKGFAANEDFFGWAYVENAAGSTIEIVRAR